VNVESPSPGVSVGQPSTKGRPENRCDDHTQGEHGHRKAGFCGGKVSSKIDCESGCSAPPPAPCTARAIRIIARLVDDPQANDEIVKITMHVIRNLLRPKRSENQELAGKIMDWRPDNLSAPMWLVVGSDKLPAM